MKSRSVVLSPQGAAIKLSGGDTVYDADDRAIGTVRYDRRQLSPTPSGR